jgi:hypothetical protein
MKMLLPFFDRTSYPNIKFTIGNVHTNTDLYVIGIYDFPNLH